MNFFPVKISLKSDEKQQNYGIFFEKLRVKTLEEDQSLLDLTKKKWILLIFTILLEALISTKLY